jgi:2-C-methyl-D-erythritol 4-phosphate cytidylyltransferase
MELKKYCTGIWRLEDRSDAGCEVRNPDFVIIHDACRPFASNALIDRSVESMINDQYI